MPKVNLNIDDGVAVITINHPEKRNALNAQVRSELFKIIRAISRRGDVRAMVITGSGDAFVAGAYISAMKDYTPDYAIRSAKEGCDLLSFIENMPIPVIAAVNGWAAHSMRNATTPQRMASWSLVKKLTRGPASKITPPATTEISAVDRPATIQPLRPARSGARAPIFWLTAVIAALIKAKPTTIIIIWTWAAMVWPATARWAAWV